MAKVINCCLGCGRDTKKEYCNRCTEHDLNNSKIMILGIDKNVNHMAEDDYSEDSNANSVYREKAAKGGCQIKSLKQLEYDTMQ